MLIKTNAMIPFLLIIPLILKYVKVNTVNKSAHNIADLCKLNIAKKNPVKYLVQKEILLKSVYRRKDKHMHTHPNDPQTTAP